MSKKNKRNTQIPSEKTKTTPVYENNKSSPMDSISHPSGNLSRNGIFIGLLSLLFLFVYLYIFDTKADLNGDNFAYYGLAKAIKTYGKYISIWEIQSLPHNHFPPGYPFILALFMNISMDPVFLVALNGIFLWGSILLLFLFIRKIQLKPSLGFVIAVLLVFNSTLLKSSTIMMSEISYLLITCLVLYLAAITDLSKKFYTNINFYLLVLSIGASFYIRSQGISILFAVVIFFLVQKKWLYAAASFLFSILLWLPWYLRSKSLGGNSYISQFLSKNPYQPAEGQLGVADLITRVGHNIERYINVEIPNGLFGLNVQYAPSYNASQWFFGLVIIAIGIYGLMQIPMKFRLLLLALLVGTFGITFMWPEQWYGTRFMFNVIPVLMLLVIVGVYQLANRIFNKVAAASLSPYFLLIMVLFFVKGVGGLHDYREDDYPLAYTNMFKIAEWSSLNTPDSSIFCCRKPEMFYYFSGKKCVNYKYGNEEEVIKGLMEMHVRYVVVEQLGYGSTGRYLVPAIRKYPDRFKMIKDIKYPDTYLFEFVPGK